ncbi:hypothetical protein HanOQP8_Chr08g0294001 [Helianthus annuus]|nr:hypothetical protein HanLR1_Chr08g0286481 [Helianthus annuus]KAJ0723088.1 hypothetical protein HanOQP8_Chr08g0294001 [Helianthus annuus]
MKSSRFIKTAFAFLILSSFHTLLTANEDPPYKEIHVGVILDMGSRVGKVINRFVIKGISDFYTANPHYRTRIVVNTRDTKGKRLLALSAGASLFYFVVSECSSFTICERSFRFFFLIFIRVILIS